jgi:hypothetical protein
MHDVLILALKGLAGGTLVVVFALVSEGLDPKRFAGLFGAAPSVAIAGLMITLLDKGAGEAHENTIGMIAGGAGMVLYAAAVVPLLKRWGAQRAAAVALGAWTAGAAVVAVPLLLLT